MKFPLDFQGPIQGFSDAGVTVYPHARVPASEKRQGTKSREVIAGGAAGAMGIEAGRGRCGAVIVPWG